MAIYAEIKNGTTMKRIETSRYKGGDYLDMRTYYDPKQGAGDWRPTRKGVTFRPEELATVAAAVASAIEEYGERLADGAAA